MKRVFASPARVIIGEGELKNLVAYINEFGKRAALIAHASNYRRMQNEAGGVLQDEALTHIEFAGLCTRMEAERLAEQVTGVDVVVGMGGGQALDAAKAVAYELGKPLVIIPTIASTDAPCSAMVVFYKETGETDEYLFLPKNPDLVLVDSGVIARAPTRYLVSGMGDAMATVFEVRACMRAGADNMVQGKSMHMVQAIAESCFDTLLENATKAKAASEADAVTPALESIIEANILMSGLGFESGGLAAAHAIHSGLNTLPETQQYLHGEKVAFGTIVQLVLENEDKETLHMVIDFCAQLGLPVCLQDLNLASVTQTKLTQVAKTACAEGKTMHNMPFEVHPQDVVSAIRTADMMGQTWVV